MSVVVLEDLSPEMYERLRQRAEARQRSLAQEALNLLSQVLYAESATPRLPDLIPGEEVAAPCDLPRSSKPVSVTALSGVMRLPDPPLLPEQE